MISLLGIVIGLALFILLAYMGYNTIIVAIASAMVVAVFGGMNPFVALTEAFMPKTVGFMQGYFLIFLFSALFARSWAIPVQHLLLQLRLHVLPREQKIRICSVGWQLWYFR